MHTHLCVEIEDAAVLPDDKRMPRREEACAEHAVGPSGRLARVAQYRVVQLEGFGELSVPLGLVDAGRKIGYVEGADPIAVLTKRTAIRSSSSGDCLGEPRQHDGSFPGVILETV